MQVQFGSRSYFQPADYAVSGIILGASLAIGLYYGIKGGGQRTSSAYILADRSMSLFPVTMSLLSSYFSGISMQGVPADVYYHGPTYIWTSISFVAGGILSLIFFTPMYYRLGLVSAYEYLRLRFNYGVEICGAISFLVFSVLYSGIVTYTACVAATAVTGVSVEVAVIVMCIICGIYTVIGGIKAVLWTDTLQMLLMLVTAIAVVLKCFVDLGFSDLWDTASRGLRTNFLYFNSDLTDFYNGWALLFQITTGGIGIASQYMVQRLVVCRTEKTAKAVLCTYLRKFCGYQLFERGDYAVFEMSSLVGVPSIVIQNAESRAIISYVVGATFFKCLVVLDGICIYAYYAGCDPTTLGYTTRNDQILPYYIVDVFSDIPGISGLLLTGLFGAALSTLSSVFNSSATLVGEYFVKPYWKELSDLTYTMGLKIIVVASAAVALGVAFVVPVIGDAIPVIFTISSCTTSVLFATYILGAFFPWCSAKGALCSFIVSMIGGITLSVGCIYYQSPAANLPLSDELCLNETVGYVNESLTTVAGMEYWNSTVVSSTLATTSSDIPVIFRLSKSWLAPLICIVTIVIALVVTLVTGLNDTSNMDPRLVIWRIKTSYVPSEKTENGKAYTSVPLKEKEDKENNIQDKSLTGRGNERSPYVEVSMI